MVGWLDDEQLNGRMVEWLMVGLLNDWMVGQLELDDWMVGQLELDDWIVE